jgi:hypothetical protein
VTGAILNPEPAWSGTAADDRGTDSTVAGGPPDVTPGITDWRADGSEDSSLFAAEASKSTVEDLASRPPVTSDAVPQDVGASTVLGELSSATPGHEGSATDDLVTGSVPSDLLSPEPGSTDWTIGDTPPVPTDTGDWGVPSATAQEAGPADSNLFQVSLDNANDLLGGVFSQTSAPFEPALSPGIGQGSTDAVLTDDDGLQAPTATFTDDQGNELSASEGVNGVGALVDEATQTAQAAEAAGEMARSASEEGYTDLAAHDTSEAGDLAAASNVASAAALVAGGESPSPGPTVDGPANAEASAQAASSAVNDQRAAADSEAPDFGDRTRSDAGMNYSVSLDASSVLSTGTDVYSSNFDGGLSGGSGDFITTFSADVPLSTPEPVAGGDLFSSDPRELSPADANPWDPPSPADAGYGGGDSYGAGDSSGGGDATYGGGGDAGGYDGGSAPASDYGGGEAPAPMPEPEPVPEPPPPPETSGGEG